MAKAKVKVFLVHGQDSGSLFELKDFLAALGLEPIVLFQEDDLGKTIIEKFEHYAPQCEFAFVLLTPDDKTADKLREGEKHRARQNVILEAGWFMRAIGRAKVVLLHKGTVELPSDLLGILYLPFKDSIYEVSERIRQRLRGQGMI
jgi:predicted nucleotide-binding protein